MKTMLMGAQGITDELIIAIARVNGTYFPTILSSFLKFGGKDFI